MRAFVQGAGAWLLVVGAAVTACRSGGPGERREYRRTHREYDGAPPVVPHAVAALGRQDCVNCHREGIDLGKDGLAPRTPHPERINCAQCHVEQVVSDAVLVANDFVGLRFPAQGTRAYEGAPPTLPHPVAGRESCIGCHGTGGGSPIRTPHADRVNCAQCHVAQEAGAAVFGANSFGGTS